MIESDMTNARAGAEALRAQFCRVGPVRSLDVAWLKLGMILLQNEQETLYSRGLSAIAELLVLRVMAENKRGCFFSEHSVYGIRL